MAKSFVLVALATLTIVISGTNGFNGFVHYQSTDSDNIHSNDTMVLNLADGISDSLRAIPGSKQQVELTFINRGRSGEFIFTGSSEDGLSGQVSPEDTRWVDRNGEIRITIFDLQVPNGDAYIDTKLKYKVNVLAKSRVRRSPEDPPESYGRQEYDDDDYFNEETVRYPSPREEFPPSLDPTYQPDYPSSGQSGGMYNPQPGDRGQGGRNPMIGGGGGSSSGGGGQGGGTFYPGGRDNNAAGYPDNRRPVVPDSRMPFIDPADRMEISRTLVFSVVSKYDIEYQDTTSPYASLSYVAQTEEETCRTSPDDPACANEWWFAKFHVYDEGTGLKSIEAKPEGHTPQILGGRPRQEFYYRYQNFPIGEVNEQKVIAGATCCHPTLVFSVSDVAGNVETLKAYSSEYGTPWFTPAVMWIIVGVSILVVVIVATVLIWCGWRQRWCYKEVSQGP